MGHWKGKLNDDEMTDAVSALNSPGTRAVADIEAELKRVAQLLSGLPTNVQPGQYASALEAHLSSVSSSLQLELEQTLLQAPGTIGTRRTVSPPCRPPPTGVGLAAPHRLAGGRLDTRVRGSSRVCAPRPRFRRQARGEHNPQSQSTVPPPASPDPHHACMHARRDRGSNDHTRISSRMPPAPTWCLFFAEPHNLAEYASLRMAAQPLQPLRFRQAARGAAGGLDPRSCPCCQTCWAYPCGQGWHQALDDPWLHRA